MSCSMIAMVDISVRSLSVEQVDGVVGIGRAITAVALSAAKGADLRRQIAIPPAFIAA